MISQRGLTLAVVSAATATLLLDVTAVARTSCMLVTFRSIVVPVKAVILNLLSVGAAHGILVLVFQDGQAENLLDCQSVGGIAPWIPQSSS